MNDIAVRLSKYRVSNEPIRFEKIVTFIIKLVK